MDRLCWRYRDCDSQLIGLAGQLIDRRYRRLRVRSNGLISRINQLGDLYHGGRLSFENRHSYFSIGPNL